MRTIIDTDIKTGQTKITIYWGGYIPSTPQCLIINMDDRCRKYIKKTFKKTYKDEMIGYMYKDALWSLQVHVLKTIWKKNNDALLHVKT